MSIIGIAIHAFDQSELRPPHRRYKSAGYCIDPPYSSAAAGRIMLKDDDAPLIRQMFPQAEIATLPRPVTGSQSRLNPTIKQVLIDHRESNSGPAD